MRRLWISGTLGGCVAAILVPAVEWEIALLVGWNTAAIAMLVSMWRIIWGADADATERIALRQDEGRRTAYGLVVGACMASLLAVGFTLVLAKSKTGAVQDVLVAIALSTVSVSWLLINTVFTLRYAGLHYAHTSRGVQFAESADDRPDYTDFAYLAFTIGMCYQVSDQALRDRRIRRTVLVHALLAYVFGVVFVASAINLVAGLGD